MSLWVRFAVSAGGLWGAAGVLIVASTDRFVTTVIQLVMFGLAVFAFSTGLGSSLGIGLATVPMLGAAVVQIAAVPEQSWLRAIAIGGLLYCGTELAWESIECRDGHQRSTAVTVQRFQEMAIVVVGALAITGLSLLVVERAPQRTLLIQVLIVGTAALALVFTIRQLGRRQLPG